MPMITKILYKQGKNKDRVHVYIDEKFCTSVRERTWIGMKITEGTNINCEDLKAKQYV